MCGLVASKQASQFLCDRRKSLIVVGRIDRLTGLATKMKILVKQVTRQAALSQFGKCLQIMFERLLQSALKSIVLIELDEFHQGQSASSRVLGR